VTVDAVLKFAPADFQVRENMVVPLMADTDARYRYFLLRKCGYTTMEAVRSIADAWGVATCDVTYGGLKDEDGITEQLLAVPIAAIPASTVSPNLRISDTHERWLALTHYGFGADKLEIGRLEGNGFRIVIRNLESKVAEQLTSKPKRVILFLNYYDTQRFGVPAGPKRTHLVGEAILAGNWDTALAELVALRAPESSAAEQWSRSPREFFDQLDPRTSGFYLSAYSSAKWNRELQALVMKKCGDEVIGKAVDGIAYQYVTNSQALGSILVDSPMIPYEKYSYADGAGTVANSVRATVIQTTMNIEACAKDPHHPGRSELTIGFFLPSGCYATTAVRQWLTFSA
jgi:tRNA pseudouridine13 synthase